MLHWTWLAHFSVWGSSLFFILVLVLAYPLIFTSDELFGVAPQLYATGVMWLCVPLSVVICLLPRYLINFINRYFRPRDVDLLREVQKYRSAELDVISKDVDPEDLPLFLPPKRRQSSVEEIEMDIFKRTRSNAEKLAKRINKNFDTLGRRLRNVASLALMHKGREQTNTGYAFAQEPGVAMHLSKMAPATSETMRRQQSLSPAVKGGPPPCKPPPYWDPSKHSSKRGDPKLTMSEGTSSRM